VPSSRIPSLDGLRALSILFVCVCHFALSPGFPIHQGWWTSLYGHCGVRIFFVISGFLITTLLMQERERTGTISLKQFFLRRAYRIVPAAYVYLAVVAVIFHRSLADKDLVVAATYLSSYWNLPWVLGHLWSLSVEEQFYLVWPLAMAHHARSARHFAFAAVAIAPVFRYGITKIGLFYGSMQFFPSVADSLAAGCLLALYQPQLEKHRSFFAWRGFPLIWAVTLSIPVLLHYSNLLKFWPLPQVVQVSAMTVFTLGVVLCIQNAITARPSVLNTPILVWIGCLSYSLYLWQMPFTNPAAPSWATTFPQNVILTLLAATISFYAVEQPIRKLGKRKKQKQKHPLGVPVPQEARDLVGRAA
jgi:peptidoglycan/LPS O-acetylase OafA/YrhL